MTVYKYFIGIDIGNDSFFAGVYQEEAEKSNDNMRSSHNSSSLSLLFSSVKEFPNSKEGIENFCHIYESVGILQHSFCVLENTAGYEKLVLHSLVEKGHNVHKGDTRKIKNFIRSFGNKEKTDKLDAKALAKYGKERHSELSLFEQE